MDFYEIMLQQKLADGGGGGSSDFSTAEVTINAEDNFLSIIYIENEKLCSVLEILESETVTALLYKGAQEVIGFPSTNVATVGDATFDSETETLFITGDCTITIS